MSWSSAELERSFDVWGRCEAKRIRRRMDAWTPEQRQRFESLNPKLFRGSGTAKDSGVGVELEVPRVVLAP